MTDKQEVAMIVGWCAAIYFGVSVFTGYGPNGLAEKKPTKEPPQIVIIPGIPPGEILDKMRTYEYSTDERHI